jgi:hypothetical protein
VAGGVVNRGGPAGQEEKTMKTLSHYPKALTLGSAMTSKIFDGSVIVQEKVDGSQFRFGKNEDGEILFGSHRQNWPDVGCVDGMFKPAVQYLSGLTDVLAAVPNDTYFFAEYLSKPKHNTLSYQRTPTNNLVLFDCLINGSWADRDSLKNVALSFGIDLIPELGLGTDFSVDDLRPLHDRESYLGGEKVEGVVIKNYGKSILLGGQVMPLFVKFVRSGFKEQNDVNFRATNPKDNLADYILSFRAEPRWIKAVQHLREDGTLTDSPKDIGPLIREIKHDIRTEESASIKDALYKFFIDEIVRRSTGGFPEWYKEQLIKSIEPEKPGESDHV